MRKLRTVIIGMEHIHIVNLSHDFNKYSDSIEWVGIAEVPPYTEEEIEMRKKLNLPNDIDFKIWDD